MAAGRIKGITIEIGGDTTKLTKALSSVDNAISKAKQNLRDLDKALKLDPTNVTLIKDRQLELGKEIENTENKVKKEKAALEELNQKLDQPWDIDHAAEFEANARAAENLKLQIDLDEAELKQLKEEAKNTASVMGTAFQAAGQQIQAVGNKIKSIGDSITAFGTKMTTTVTVPIVAAGAKAVTSFAEVDKTMTLANKTMNNTTEEAKMLNSAMEEAAANSTFGMSDAANAALNFARAGLSATEAANAMAPAMNLAAGESGELDTVSAGLVATINGFGDGFEEAEHYADVFAAACNNSALDVNSLSESMSVAAPIFKTAGKDVEDAALMLGVMANAGIEAEVAANSLKTGMARLAQPTKQAREAMEQYGIAMADIWNEDGSMKDMTVIQENLNKSFSQLSEQEQMAAAGAIFGKNQMASWLAVINTAPADVQALNASLQDVDGTTREMADAMMSGFGGSIERLKSSIDVLMTSLGSLLAQYLTPIIEKIQTLVDKFMSLDEETQNMIVKIAMIAAAIGPVALVIGGIVGVISKIVVGIGLLVEHIGILMTILTNIGTFVTGTILPALAAINAPVIAIVAIIGALTAAIIYLWNTNEGFRETVLSVIESLKTSVLGFIEGLQPMFEQVMTLLSVVKDFVVAVVQELVTSVKTRLDAHRDTLNAIMTTIKLIIEVALVTIKAVVSNTLSFIQNLFKTVLDLIIGIVKTFTAIIKGDWEGALNSIKETASNIINDVLKLFSDLGDNLSSFFGDLVDKFADWGRDMIGNLVDGIRSRISDVTSAIGDVASAIASFIHFSEPDVGPLSNFHTFMPDMIKEMVQGINQGLPQLENAMSGMASTLVPSAGQLSAGSSSVSNTVTINVYGAQGQDVSELADIIQDRINQAVYSQEAVFA